MMKLPRRIASWSLALAALLAAPGTRAQTAGSSSGDLAKLKAAFVLNFARYAEWPQSSFAGDSSPIAIGVIGDDGIAVYLEELAAGETIEGRRIVVNRLEPHGSGAGGGEGGGSDLGERLRHCHLVFMGAAAEDRVNWMLDSLTGEDVLTVGDVGEFAERGGMIGLVVRNRRLAFDANVREIDDTRISLSSQVLRLARIVGAAGS